MGQTNSQLLDITSSAGRRAGNPFARIQALCVAHNVLAVNREFAAVLAKLDGGGPTDTNYAATLTPTNVKDTLTKFNALLTKLDADVLVTATDYVATCKAFTEGQLPAQYAKLLKKLDGDVGVNVSTFTSGNSAYTVQALDD